MQSHPGPGGQRHHDGEEKKTRPFHHSALPTMRFRSALPNS
jgi:hypothetical protein